MPTIPDECVFEIPRSGIVLNTQVNGDRVTISGIHFTKESGGALSWLINNPDVEILQIKVREKP